MRIRSAPVFANLAFGAVLVAAMAAPPMHESPQTTQLPVACKQRPTTFLVGDSLTFNMVKTGSGATYLNSQAPTRFHIDGQKGRATRVHRKSVKTGQATTPGTEVLARSRSARKAGTWVVELGTNDSKGFKGFLKDIALVMAQAHARPVKWVNVYRGVRRPDYRRDPINAALDKARVKYRNLEILDWASLVATNPEWVARDSSRIHPNADGSRALADLIVGSLRC